MKVLFIDIDTLRPDHMGCYGYQRQTTPCMDQVAADGVVFNDCYTSDAPCLPSRAALISGMFGFRNGAIGHGGTGADRRLTGKKRGFRDPIDQGNFHNVFRRAGLYTASISSFPERHSAWWFNGGLNETHNCGQGGSESGEVIIPTALDWLDKKKEDDDWFLHVHLWDPHTPYRAPEGFGNPFEDEPIQSWYSEKILEKHKKHTGPHSIMETGMYTDEGLEDYPRQPGKCQNMDQLKTLLDGYDTGIRYADFLIEQLIDKLKAEGIYEDTAIVITSDHGENMGELGIYSEHGTADHATCHIPMIIKWPGTPGGQSVDGFMYNLDLLPTMADLLSVDQVDHWDGLSYAQALKTNQTEVTHREALILSQNAHVCQRSARFGDWLYMRTYHDGYHLFDKEMLFNLEKDPYEQVDAKENHPAVCAQGAKLILDWQDKQMMKDLTNRDPMWTVMEEGGPEHTHTDLEAYIQRLEATGRQEGAEQLRKKYL